MIRLKGREMENTGMRKGRAPRRICHFSIKSLLNISFSSSLVIPGERKAMESKNNKGKVVQIIQKRVVGRSKMISPNFLSLRSYCIELPNDHPRSSKGISNRIELIPENSFSYGLARAKNARELPIRKGRISGSASINQEVVLEGYINNKISDPSEAKSACYTNRRNKTLTSKGRRSKSFGDERERLSFNFKKKDDVRFRGESELFKSPNCFRLSQPLAVPPNNFHRDYFWDPSGSVKEKRVIGVAWPSWLSINLEESDWMLHELQLSGVSESSMGVRWLGSMISMMDIEDLRIFWMNGVPSECLLIWNIFRL